MRKPKMNPADAVGESLLTTVQLADYLHSTPRTLEDWRLNGVGPRYIKLGQLVRYRLADVDAWLAANTVETTGAGR